MKNILINLFGLKGSWRWACKHMLAGGMVRPKGITGAVAYRADSEGQGRILWAFSRAVNEKTKWENANIFIKDFSQIYIEA